MESLLVQIPLLASIFCVSNGLSQGFDYKGPDGPSHWGDHYSTCVGKYQSPINIHEKDVEVVHLPPLQFKNLHLKVQDAQITNNGHTVMVELKTDTPPIVYGGPLKSEYVFAQLHFHWGENDTIGSENLIDNVSYPLEMHTVFYNKPYGDASNALVHHDGLTVLSFLFEVSDDNNTNYEEISETLKFIDKPGSIAKIEEGFSLGAHFGEDTDTYFTYEGSLTTPPCSEVVQWIEFRNRIKLSHSQLMEFRKLHNWEGMLINNFRPVQPLNDRQILFNTHSAGIRYSAGITCFVTLLFCLVRLLKI